MTGEKKRPEWCNTEEGKRAVHVFEQMGGLLDYLWTRWQDEREYEDFADYKKEVKEYLLELDADAIFLTMTKRPFTFKFAVGSRMFKIKVTSKAYTMTLEGLFTPSLA